MRHGRMGDADRGEPVKPMGSAGSPGRTGPLAGAPPAVAPAGPDGRPSRAKRAFDLAVSILLLPTLGLIALALLIANPWFNRGPLLVRQKRMGRGCQAFWAWKFRTMSEAEAPTRGPFDGLETGRITPLGQLLRRSRIDELPQVVNVLRGEMSLIGPRPDPYEHAQAYLETVPGYRERHAVLPGISGHAQIVVGYVDGPEGLRDKVAADLEYVRNASLRFDLWIAWRTLGVVLGRHGA